MGLKRLFLGGSIRSFLLGVMIQGEMYGAGVFLLGAGERVKVWGLKRDQPRFDRAAQLREIDEEAGSIFFSDFQGELPSFLHCYWVGSLDFNLLGNRSVFH